MRTDSVAVVLGTRPEIIKLAFIIKALGPAARVVHTGQHFDQQLFQVFLDAFELPDPSVHLGVGGKTRGSQIGSATQALDALFADERPDFVVVQGDTNTTLAGALAANAQEIPIVHVEAGLRSRDRRMPEEHNRVLTDHLADLLCAPTEVAVQNARMEGIPDERIELTGNTIVEAVHHLMPDSSERKSLLSDFELTANEFVVSTFHRPENVDDPKQLGSVLRQLALLQYPVLLPLHPRTRSVAEQHGLDSMFDGIRVIDPIGYREFLGLSAESAFLVSDSGGIQEESSIYKRPVIVVRRSTERPEVLNTFARLVDISSVSDTAREWLADPQSVHHELIDVPSPYGDGSASTRIVGSIARLAETRR